MKKTMKRISVITLILTICFFVLYKITNNRILFSFLITFGTTAYHFTIRLIIGGMFDLIMKNRANYEKRWYQVSKLEMKFYQKIKVKQWKNKMPTYDVDVFDTSKHSWNEIIQATCQSELVHETNVIFSFFPIIGSVWFGSFEIFLITSIMSAIFDSMFVFMQRFNRARILKIKVKSRKNGYNSHVS